MTGRGTGRAAGAVAFAGVAVAVALGAGGVVAQAEDPRGVRVQAAPLDDAQRAFDRSESAGLFVGVRTFSLPGHSPEGMPHEVPFAVDDAIDLAHLFALELELISPARVFLCLSGEPHKARSRERLESLVAAGTLPPAPATNSGLRVQVQRTCDVSGPAGMLVMAFATHGVRTADGDDCLLASDSLRADPETMLKARWLSAKTEAAASPRRLLFFDACRERMLDSRGAGDGGRIEPESFARVLGEAQGLYSLFAAPPGGLSFDDRDRGNGVFTGALLDALHGAAAPDERGLITLEAVERHVDRQVREWVAIHRPVEPGGKGVYQHGGADMRSMPLAVHRPPATSDAPAGPAGVASGTHDTRSTATSASLLVSAHASGQVRLWDPVTGARVGLLRHGSMARAAAPVPGGTRLVAGGEHDGTARLWDRDGKSLATLRGHEAAVWSVACSRDGLRLLTGSADGSARTWDAVTGAPLLVLAPATDPGLPPVRAVAFSQDGQRILTAGDDRAAHVWDADDGRELGVLRSHGREVLAVAFAPDGRHAITGSSDMRARIWSLDTLKPAADDLLPGGAVWAVAWSPDGARVVTGSTRDGQGVMAFDAPTGRSPTVLSPSSSRITCVAFSPDGAWLAAGGADGMLRLYDARTLAWVRDLDGSGAGAVMSVAF